MIDAASLPFELERCDIIVVRHAGGFCHLEPWRMQGELAGAMHGAVRELFAERHRDDALLAEFALGFVAAMDAVGSGSLRFSAAKDEAGLVSAITRAFDEMHGNMSDVALSELAELARRREAGAR